MTSLLLQKVQRRRMDRAPSMMIRMSTIMVLEHAALLLIRFPSFEGVCGTIATLVPEQETHAGLRDSVLC